MLDTNVLISAFIFKSEIINRLIQVLSEEHEIMIASYCIDELNEVINEKFNVSRDSLDIFLRKFPFNLVYSPTNINSSLFDIRDKDDYIILYTAIKNKADIFITGDKDFKDVKLTEPKILTPREFLEKY